MNMLEVKAMAEMRAASKHGRKKGLHSQAMRRLIIMASLCLSTAPAIVSACMHARVQTLAMDSQCQGPCRREHSNPQEHQ